LITYHTFPSKETKEVLVTKNPEATEARETSRVSSVRNISGFNTETNKKISWCGIDFSFPSYFDKLDKGSTETEMSYYPTEEYCNASIMFQSIECQWTREQFISQIPSIIENSFANAKLQKSEETTIAGLPGWTITYSISDTKEVGLTSTGSTFFVYNTNTGKIAFITSIYDSNDQSQYDYLGDHKKVLETAKLDKKASAIKENAPPTPTPTLKITKDSTTDIITVYITKSGKKYHSSGCRSLSKSKIPISLEEAKSRGYEPCSLCH
jgi:hypothetical protein